LIDEYDAPLNHAFRKGFYEAASAYFGIFYSCALKQDGESTLEKACLMGIVEVRGAGILSGLNNVTMFCFSNEQYSCYFGFLAQEIENYVDGDVTDVIEWYNGYYFGSARLINPWSFMNYLKSNKLDSYWVGSAYVETLPVILKSHTKSVLASVVN
jgi:hypothetical protein